MSAKLSLSATTLSIALTGLALNATADTGFLIIGDGGTGTEAQHRVARAMLATCQTQPCDFVLGLGDNIYESGPKSVNDQQFHDKFETPYADLDIPFFMVQGNHDNSLIIPGDGGFNQRGFHEVYYTEKSSKWRMPARYYSFETPNDSALFIGYDSNPPSAYLPALFSPYWWPNGRYMQEQKAWVQETLAESDSAWKFAFAHHPLYTNGHHGKDPLLQGHNPYRNFVKESFCGKVDFLLAGHEHALEILAPMPECGNTYLVVSGAAAKNSGKRTNAKYESIWDDYNKKWGYMHGLIQGNQFTLSAFVVDSSGVSTLAYQNTFYK